MVITFGPDETVKQTYEQMFREIAALNLQQAACILEEYAYDYVVQEQEADYVKKIMIHVIKKDK